MKFSSVKEFSEKNQRWLNLEQFESFQQNELLFQTLTPLELQNCGILLLKLKVKEVTAGLYGRIIVTLAPKTGVDLTANPENSSSSTDDDSKIKPLNKEVDKDAKKEDNLNPLPRDRLPAHNMTSGDIVGLYDGSLLFQPESASEGAVIHEVKNEYIRVILNNSNAGDSTLLSSWRLVHVALKSADVTFKRQIDVLDRLENHSTSSSSPTRYLISCCFGETAPRFSSSPLTTLLRCSPSQLVKGGADDCYAADWRSYIAQDLQTLDGLTHLNESQRTAVAMALRTIDLSCIHGPPGTGKTTTLVACIQKFVSQGKRILATAPSNVGVDNLLEKCVASGLERCIRLGHPSRVSDKLTRFCLDNKIRSTSSFKLCKDIKSEIDAELRQLTKLRNKSWRGITQNEYKNRKSVISEKQFSLRVLQKELKQREKKIVQEALSSANIVFTTCVGANDKNLIRLIEGDGLNPPQPFDVVCIDEAAQGLEVGCWIPALLGSRVLLAGDHKQLPPTVKSLTASSEGFSISLFERVIEKFGTSISHMLDLQYRMHETIMRWPSEIFYSDSIRAADSAAKRSLAEWIVSSDCCPSPLFWLDTAGIDEALELNHDNSVDTIQSRSNLYEASMVVKYLEHLCALLSHLQVPLSSCVGVITPYNAQVELIRYLISESTCPDDVKAATLVSTVDGFQGQERDIIILSLVRSNRQKRIGFLNDHRRLNVAVTRAKRHVVIIGDSETISVDPVLKTLFASAAIRGEIESTASYLEASDISPHFLLPPPKQKKPSNVINDVAGSRDSRMTTSMMKNTAMCNTKMRHVEHLDEAATYRVILTRVLERGGSYVFPETLNSYHRNLIHKLSEELNLNHVSVGEPPHRKITVSTKTGKARIAQKLSRRSKQNRKSEEARFRPATESVRESAFKIGISREAKPSPFLNLSLSESSSAEEEKESHDNSSEKSIHCRSSSSSKQTDCRARSPQSASLSSTSHDDSSEEEIQEPSSCSIAVQPEFNAEQAKQKKKKKKKKNCVIVKEEAPACDSEMELIENEISKSKTCQQDQCGASTQLLGRVCQYCRQRFCFEHSMPEVHGCGCAVRRDAKQKFKAAAAVKALPVSSIRRDIKRSHLSTNLRKKIATAQEARQTKPSDSKK